jgi:hypothetical protein
VSRRLAGLSSQLKEARAQHDKQEEVSGLVEPNRKQSDRVRHTIYLPPDLSYKVKFEKLETGEEISEIVARAVQLYFEKKESRNGSGPNL